MRSMVVRTTPGRAVPAARRILGWTAVVVAAVVTGPATAAPPLPAEAESAAAARAILAAYHAEPPAAEPRRLHVISWRARDREFPVAHRERLDRMLTHIQSFYADEMERLGFGRRTIQLVRDGAGRLVVHEVVGEGSFADYGKPDGQRIRRECQPVLKAAGIDMDRETTMIFTNLASWDPRQLTFSHNSPYYAGGDHRSGTAYQLDSPELDTRNLPLREPLLTDGEYGRISLGRHASIFIGGMAHELGHALGLPHCRARDDEAAAHGTALMGAGNRTYGEELRGEGKGSFLTLADGLQLASHPQFSGSTRGLHAPVRATLSTPVATPAGDGRSFTIRGRVAGAPPIHGIVAYLDPAGGGDYDARTRATAPDADGGFVIECDALVADRPASLRLVACHANGGTTTWTHGYTVRADGTVDIDAVRLAFEMEDFLAAVDRGDLGRAATLGDALPAEGRARSIAATILAARAAADTKAAPAAVPADVRSLPLSAARPAEARVGWLQPTYDHLPRREALLISAGRVFERGIYAHAASLHRYDLGGRWNRLTGACGLPVSPGGSVVFVVRADGREIYRSDRLGPDRLADYDLDVEGVRTLELETTDGGDGKNSDWGVWFDPTLTRPASPAAGEGTAEPAARLFPDPPGLCSYTFRAQFAKDVAGTLDAVKALGITDLEFSNLFGLAAADLRRLLDERGMACSSYGVGYEPLMRAPDRVAEDAKTLGATHVRVAWIPHTPPFTAARAREAAADFNRVGRLLRERHGLRFCYHNHGYEFVPEGDGTLFDLLMAHTDPADVGIELDILWAHFPGADPAALLDRYGSRIRLLHLKDLKRGVRGDLTGKTDPEHDVVLGTGQLDIPAILRAARRAGVAHYYIEDESAAAPAQVPRSLAYLRGLAK